MPEIRTCAKLLKDGTVKACSPLAHFKWSQFGPGKRLSKLRYDPVENYSVETRFNGKSFSLDGPHLFWSLEVTKYEGSASHRSKDLSGGFLTALEDTLALKCATLEQLFAAHPKAV